tara:strand:- start:3815 stop:5089 length:1275 start_codon:yes stop_codon:yes gene_type:complete
MRVLLLGSGGREHAMAWKMSQSSILEELFIAPGNAGTKQIGKNVELSADNFEEVKKFVLNNRIDSVVVGPEGPLVNGIADFFESDNDLSGVSLVGPNKEAAQLEGSKDFAKKFMKRHNIPTAKYGTFTKETISKGYDFLDTMKSPYVLKADGLAAGKGVLILDNLKEAKKELKSMLSDAKFGDASSRVVIEEFLDGVELSCFIITDGDGYKKLPEAKDYKRIGEGDTGLNTGGMGAISPVPFANPTFLDKIDNQIIIPTVKGLRKEGIKYKGFIFFGIINVRNEPYVIEYNCRMGDPESEVVFPRLKSDILDLIEGVGTNTLSERDVVFDERSAATVMMVSEGYPAAYSKGKQVYGLNTVADTIVFHAGTTSDGPVVTTSGGRVLAATSMGKDLPTALKKSYEAVGKIEFDGAYYRKDIGQDVL